MGLDVFDDHPPFALDNMILSPHSPGLGKEVSTRRAISAARNTLADIDGASSTPR